MSDYKVELVEDNISEFHVVFKGPPESALRTAAGAGCCRRRVAALLAAGLGHEPATTCAWVLTHGCRTRSLC